MGHCSRCALALTKNGALTSDLVATSPRRPIAEAERGTLRAHLRSTKRESSNKPRSHSAVESWPNLSTRFMDAPNQSPPISPSSRLSRSSRLLAAFACAAWAASTWPRSFASSCGKRAARSAASAIIFSSASRAASTKRRLISSSFSGSTSAPRTASVTAAADGLVELFIAEGGGAGGGGTGDDGGGDGTGDSGAGGRAACSAAVLS
mmetsp:Transcript_7919/g.24693  ORF Transcript_7919/g.24693 Transcript_7919/m.24693 type:complete len:207 (+) Transcript_7919:241-861(+)